MKCGETVFRRHTNLCSALLTIVVVCFCVSMLMMPYELKGGVMDAITSSMMASQRVAYEHDKVMEDYVVLSEAVDKLYNRILTLENDNER